MTRNNAGSGIEAEMRAEPGQAERQHDGCCAAAPRRAPMATSAIAAQPP